MLEIKDVHSAYLRAIPLILTVLQLTFHLISGDCHTVPDSVHIHFFAKKTADLKEKRLKP